MLLIKERLNPKYDLNNRPTCLLMSRVGDGKTTLVNMLCGTDHSSGNSSGSITRELFLNKVSYGNNPFDIIDTPGTESNEEAFRHAYLLRHALTAKPLNTIFILIKYESRYNLLVERYEKLLELIAEYENKCVILISHLDLAKNPQEEFATICELFEENEIDSNIIFYSKESNKTQLSNAIYDCISNMSETQLSISEIDLFTRFKIHSVPKVRQMRKSFEECKCKIENTTELYTNTIAKHNLIQADERDEWLHSLIVSHSKCLNEILDEYRVKFQNKMNDLDFYFFYIEMQSDIIKKEDALVEKVRPAMSYDLFDKSDPRNFIKRCPNCDEIWFKVEGCDGETQCGNIPEKGEICSNIFNKLKFVFSIDFNSPFGKKITWNKPTKTIDTTSFLFKLDKTLDDFPQNINLSISFLSQINLHFDQFDNREKLMVFHILGKFGTANNLVMNFDMDKIESKILMQLTSINQFLVDYKRKHDKRYSRKAGCGASFIWKDQPPLPLELICEIYKVSTIDKVNELLSNKSNENWERKISDEIKTINTDFSN